MNIETKQYSKNKRLKCKYEKYAHIWRTCYGWWKFKMCKHSENKKMNSKVYVSAIFRKTIMEWLEVPVILLNYVCEQSCSCFSPKSLSNQCLVLSENWSDVPNLLLSDTWIRCFFCIFFLLMFIFFFINWCLNFFVLVYCILIILITSKQQLR